ncbi:MAG: hypothetical protein PUI85_02095 [Eubacteriales bacterium]|nr:hypothetical protein [Eubacteriales bacterium]
MSLIMNVIAKIIKDAQGDIIGRVGGNIPSCLLIKEKEIKEYYFYVTFQNPDNKEEYISIFVPKSYNEMIGNSIYPSCSIKVFTHQFSGESDNWEYTITHINKTPIVGFSRVESREFNFITKSDSPYLIQDEDHYSEALEKDEYIFFAQIDEDYYPENLLNGNYIFGYGALYLYKHRKTGEIVAGFFQYS